jgi:hypothetical protein
MGTKTVKFSDLSGQEVEDDSQLARLVVEEHPGYGQPLTLEVLADEVEGQLPEETRFVRLSYYAPGARDPEQWTVPVDAFNQLAKRADMSVVLDDALEAYRQERAQARAAASEPAPRGRRRREGAQSAERVDYTSPEHAGMPHRGRTTEAEREYVRTHLKDVNARRKEAGHPEIDPKDPKMQERYGLTADQKA